MQNATHEPGLRYSNQWNKHAIDQWEFSFETLVQTVVYHVLSGDSKHSRQQKSLGNAPQFSLFSHVWNSWGNSQTCAWATLSQIRRVSWGIQTWRDMSKTRQYQNFWNNLWGVRISDETFLSSEWCDISTESVSHTENRCLFDKVIFVSHILFLLSKLNQKVTERNQTLWRP